MGRRMTRYYRGIFFCPVCRQYQWGYYHFTAKNSIILDEVRDCDRCAHMNILQRFLVNILGRVKNVLFSDGYGVCRIGEPYYDKVYEN